jgi:hypothetical protein
MPFRALQRFADRRPRAFLQYSIYGLVIVALVVSAAFKRVRFVSVYLDNGNQREVTVLADSGDRAMVPPHSVALLTVPRGERKLTARSIDGVVDEIAIATGLFGPRTYVFNIGMANGYAADHPGVDVVEPLAARGHVFAMPDGLSAGFAAWHNPAEAALIHWPAHPGWPCCTR